LGHLGVISTFFNDRYLDFMKTKSYIGQGLRIYVGTKKTRKRTRENTIDDLIDEEISVMDGLLSLYVLECIFQEVDAKTARNHFN